MKRFIIIFTISMFILILPFGVCAEMVDNPEEQNDESEPMNQESSNIQDIVLSNEMDEYQRAVVEVAKQYYYRGPNIIYNQNSIFKLGNKYLQTSLYNSGVRNWSIVPFSPEDAIENNMYNLACTNFTWQVYEEAFCHQFLDMYKATTLFFVSLFKDQYNAELAEEEQENSLIPYYYKVTGEETQEAIDEQLSIIKSRLRVGDIVTIRRYHSNGDKTGHSMLYIGNNSPEKTGKSTFVDSTHPGGVADIYRFSNKIAPYDTHGTIYSNDASRWFDSTATNTYYLFYSSDSYSVTDIIIIRPLANVRAGEYDNSCYLKTQNRLNFPDLVINKTSSLNRTDVVEPCDEITYNVKLENKSGSNYETSIPFDLEIPENTTLVSGNPSGSLNLGAGETKVISYTVKVNEDAEYGTYIENTGSVGGIELNTLKNQVAGKLSNAEKNTLKSMALEKQYDTSIDMIDDIYKALYGYEGFRGLEADDFINSVLKSDETQTTFTASSTGVEETLTHNVYRLLKENEIPDNDLHSMWVNHLYGGYLVSNTTQDEWYNRYRDIRLEDLNVGDILTTIIYDDYGYSIYRTRKWHKNIYLYVGEAKLVTVENGEKKVIEITDEQTTSPQLIASLYGEVAFTVHRPSLVLQERKTSCTSEEPQVITDVPDTLKNNLIIIIAAILVFGVGVSAVCYAKSKINNRI